MTAYHGSSSRLYGGGRAIEAELPEPPTPEENPAVNLFLNSKFTAASAGVAPTNWTIHPSGGSITPTASALAEHIKMQAVSTTTDYTTQAQYRQDVSVVAGQTYVFQIHVTANAGSNPDHVILNHTPFDNATLVSSRPTSASAMSGQVSYYILTATRTGALTLIVGPDRTGDVTLERPCFDNYGVLRQYAATDAVAPPDPSGDIDPLTIPWDGLYEGWTGLQNSNNSSRLSGGRRGYRFEVKRSGTDHVLDEIQFQVASNFSGEISKSYYNGTNAHGYPANWNFRVDIYASNGSWQMVGSPLKQTSLNYVNATGSPAAGGDSRVICAVTNLNLTGVDQGDRFVVELVNLEGTPATDHFSVNANSISPSYGCTWVGPNASPPEAAGLYLGDTCMACAISGTSTSSINSMMQGIAWRFDDDVEEGCIAFDATPSTFGFVVYGTTNIVRYRLVAPYYRRAYGFNFAAWHSAGTVPAAGLRFTLSGPGVSVAKTVPAASVTARGGTLRTVYVPFDTPVVLVPDEDYYVVLDAPGVSSGAAYQIGATRSAGYLGSPEGRITPDQGVFRLIDRHGGSGVAQRSTDSGASWTTLGFSGGGANLSYALVLNGDVASTLEGLSGG